MAMYCIIQHLMKNTLAILLLATFLFSSWANSVYASTVVRTGESVSISDDQRVQGDFYVVTGSLAQLGAVDGDLVAAAGTAMINGSVAEDILLLAGSTNIGATASVTDDVRVFGNDVVVAGPIEGSLFVLGNSLTILSTGSVGGDVLFLGRTLNTEGNVAGQVLGRADQININGEVGLGVDVVTHSLSLGERANVDGDVRYVSGNDLNRSLESVITGETVKSDMPSGVTEIEAYKAKALSFLIILLSSLAIFFLARRPLMVFAHHGTKRLALHALAGIGTLLALLVLLLVTLFVMLFVNIIGAVFGLAVLSALALLCIMALPLMNILLAAILTKTLQHKVEVNIIWITVGSVVVQIILLVPVVGTALFLAMLFITIGSFVTGFYSILRAVK